MNDFFKNLDLSKLDEKSKAFVELTREGVETAITTIRSQSAIIADSAKKTVEIGNEAVVQLVAGKLDQDASLRIFRRGSEQMEDLARAEGNLLVSNSVSFLKKLGETVLKFAKGFFGG